MRPDGVFAALALEGGIGALLALAWSAWHGLWGTAQWVLVLVLVWCAWVLLTVAEGKD